ncbi:hypothetical protein D9M71_784100 [compost metagenome]
MPRMNIEITADSRIAVPVAEIGSSLNTAGIAVGLATMGAVLTTSWSRCGMAKLNTRLYSAPSGRNIALNGFRVQMVTITVSTRNGDQALTISPTL